MIYWLVRFLSKCIFKTFYDFKIYGAENLPEKGPYLICSNHCSFFDPAVICACVPQRVYWVALKDLYKIRPLSLLLKAAKCIPVNGATKEVLDAIKQGKIIGIFPEGRRTYNGKLMKKGKKGTAIMAMRSGVPVVPAWISGTFQAYPRRAKFPRIYPIRIYIGKPLTFPKHQEEIINESTLSAATTEIMQSIAGLMP